METSLTRYEALIACRDKAGSDSQMGRDLGIPQSTMWRIINSSKQLPGKYVLAAEHRYGVSRHDLRPDLYPPRDCRCARCLMVDLGTPGRFYGSEVRMANAADRYMLGERIRAQAGG